MFRYLISDVELERELMYDLKRRKLEQKFVYIGEGAKNYYDAYGSDDNRGQGSQADLNYSKLEYFDFIESHLEKGMKIALINLGCGNGYQEKILIGQLSKVCDNFTYFGVDSSKEMLELAQENLKEVDAQKNFICADFTSAQFKNEINNITGKYDIRIVSFLGWTFGNPNQTNITESIYNMMYEGDFLWFDVLSRDPKDYSAEMRLFDRYSHYIKNDGMVKFHFGPLKKLGIPYENGKMVLQTSNEDVVGALVFKFAFQFLQKTVISYRSEKLYFLKDESVEVYNIRNYDSEKLTKYFTNHDFDLVKKNEVKMNSWLQETQFLFRK